MARRALNSQFDWYAKGTLKASINKPSVGDLAVDFPRTRIKRAPGWDALPDVDDSVVIAPVGIPGEYPAPRTTRGKTQIFELQVQGLTEPTLVAHRQALRAAFSDRSSIGFLIARPWSVYGSDQWMTWARVSDYAGDDEQIYPATGVPSPWKRDPTLTLRQIDGFWYWWNETGTPSVPKQYIYSTGGNVENAGDAPTYPVITVAGVSAGQDVHIGRTVPGGTNVDLWFRQPGAGTLVIDFNPPRHVVLNGFTDVSKSFDAATANNWWDPFVDGIPPGVHEIWKGPGAGTSIQIGFFSASV